MKETAKTKRSLILTTIICCIYLLLTIFYHHIDKNLSGILYIFLTVLIPITFVIIIVFEIKGIIKIIRNRRNFNFKICLPTIVCTITLLYTLYDGKEVKQLGGKILISNGYLNPIGKSFDRKKYPRPMFYLGNCRNEN